MSEGKLREMFMKETDAATSGPGRASLDSAARHRLKQQKLSEKCDVGEIQETT